jgi:hypothetical protein
LAYNFNDNPFSPPGGDSHGALGTSASAGEASVASPPSGPAPASSDSPESAALIRFRSCRWQQPKDESGNEFCTHREVKPYAGTTGFDADAWCPDCQYYKLRRAPKKRDPRDEYSY